MACYGHGSYMYAKQKKRLFAFVVVAVLFCLFVSLLVCFCCCFCLFFYLFIFFVKQLCD